jgi:putative colanic acid biosysnthesis UDP-glucose lipid carrier transferase
MRSHVVKQRLTCQLLVDILMLNLAFVAAFVIRFQFSHVEPGLFDDGIYRVLLITANLLYFSIHIFTAQNILRLNLVLDGREAFKQTATKYLLFVTCYLGIIVFTKNYGYSRTFHFYVFALFPVAMLLGHTVLRPLVEKWLLFIDGRSRVLVVGGEGGQMVASRVLAQPKHYKYLGLLDDVQPNHPKFKSDYRGRIENLEEVIRAEGADEVLICLSPEQMGRMGWVVKTAERNCAVARIVPSYHQALTNHRLSFEDLLGLPVITVSSSKLERLPNQLIKRLLDMAISGLFLILVFPLLLLVVAPAIWLSSEGPLLFRQRRKGYRGEPFVCYKFRTMKLGDKAMEVIQATEDDPRKTRLGDVLRRTSLDEIPQLINVFKGEMSLVGPRPHMLEHDESFSKVVSEYNLRFVAKPGLTGWAQVNGHRGATTTPDSIRKRVEHDIWYIEHWSLWLDVKIMLLTVVRLLKGDPNAY